jgi:hypothetical protein
MKTTLMLLTLLLISQVALAADDIEQFRYDNIAPDFLASFYDHYTVNLLNARSLGMGGTAVSMQGGIEYALVNPAAFRAGMFQLYLEGNVKASVKEMNSYALYEEDNNEAESQNLESGMPSGMFGFGFAPTPYLSLGTSFSLPQTVRYSMLTRELKTGAFLDRFPTMNNYQTTFTVTGHYEPVSIGLNVIYNYYTFRELRIIAQHFDRIIFEKGLLRFQPGIYYSNDHIAIGASYKFAAEEEIKMGNSEPYYHIYDTHFPAVFETGISYNFRDDMIIALALEFEQTSKQYELFDDRLKMKIGFEKELENYNIRAGIISVPGIYTGGFGVPEDSITEGEFEFYPLPYDHGIVAKTDQLLVTGGLTYFLPDVDVNLAFAKDVLQNMDLFQFVISMDIRLGEVIARGKPQSR